MRTKLFIGAASALVLVIAAVAFAGAFRKPEPPVTEGYICPVTGEVLPCADCCPYKAQAAKASAPTQSCCTEQDCCPECLACCAEDGCCWECIQCCIDMGCDPASCFSASTSAKAKASGAKPVAKTTVSCCPDGCCK